MTLIETGTYRGDSIWALRDSFSEIHSVELDRTLYESAQRRFKGLEHVHLHLGDSGQILLDILSRIEGPALLFLDGHYSGGVTARGALETPITVELDAALAPTGFDHVILIDDARCFQGEKGYPTLDEVRKATLARKPHLSVTVSNDIIRICPPGDGPEAAQPTTKSGRTGLQKPGAIHAEMMEDPETFNRLMQQTVEGFG